MYFLSFRKLYFMTKSTYSSELVILLYQGIKFLNYNLTIFPQSLIDFGEKFVSEKLNFAESIYIILNYMNLLASDLESNIISKLCTTGYLSISSQTSLRLGGVNDFNLAYIITDSGNSIILPVIVSKSSNQSFIYSKLYKDYLGIFCLCNFMITFRFIRKSLNFYFRLISIH